MYRRSLLSLNTMMSLTFDPASQVHVFNNTDNLTDIKSCAPIWINQAGIGHRAIRAQEWMEGWALSPSTAMKAITTMSSPPFKRIDILNAENVFGPAKSYVKGSTTKPGGLPQPGERRNDVNSIQLHCDIWTVDAKRQLHFLVSTTTPKRFRNIDSLKSKTATEIQRKLQRHMTPLLSDGLNVQLVAFDGEKAVACDDTEALLAQLKTRLDINAGTHIPYRKFFTMYFELWRLPTLGGAVR